MGDSGKSSVDGLSSLPSVLKVRSGGQSGGSSSQREMFIDPNDFTENMSQMGVTQFELNLKLNKE